MTDTTNAANSSPITAECAVNKLVLEAMDTWFSQSDGITIPVPFELFHEIRAALLAAPQPQGGAIHAAIMNLRCNVPDEHRGVAARMAYRTGHRDARHAAAEIALSQSAPSAPQQAGDGLTGTQRTLEWVKEVLARHIDIDCPSCDCKECEQCGKMPKDCSGTECARTCQCSDCDHCQATGALKELRALLAAPRQPGEMGAGVPEYNAYQRDWEKLIRYIKFNAETFPELANMSPEGAIGWLVYELAQRHERFAEPASAQQDEREAVWRAVGVLETLTLWGAEEWSELFERNPPIVAIVAPLLAALPKVSCRDAYEAEFFTGMSDPSEWSKETKECTELLFRMFERGWQARAAQQVQADAGAVGTTSPQINLCGLVVEADDDDSHGVCVAFPEDEDDTRLDDLMDKLPLPGMPTYRTADFDGWGIVMKFETEDDARTAIDELLAQRDGGNGGDRG